MRRKVRGKKTWRGWKTGMAEMNDGEGEGGEEGKIQRVKVKNEKKRGAGKWMLKGRGGKSRGNFFPPRFWPDVTLFT